MERSDLRQELHRVLDLAYATGKVPTGAWVKQQLIQRVSDFDETNFGHASFLDFLRSFSDLVEITERPGSDFIVRLRDQPELFPVSEIQTGGVPYIRSDLWEAFAFVRRADDGWVYDRQEGKALPKDSVDDISEKTSDDFAEIPPLPEQELKQWMGEFADAWPEETVSQALSEALSGEGEWLGKFNSVLRTFHQEVQQAWRRKRAFRVIQRIRDWADDEEVELGTIVKAPDEEEQRAERGTPEEVDDRSVRERILSILQQAPTSELLQIRLPIGLVLDLDPE